MEPSYTMWLMRSLGMQWQMPASKDRQITEARQSQNTEPLMTRQNMWTANHINQIRVTKGWKMSVTQLVAQLTHLCLNSKSSSSECQ